MQRLHKEEVEEFLETPLILPLAPASSCRWHSAQKEKPVQRDTAEAIGSVAEHSLHLWPIPRRSSALLRRWPVCHLLHQAQIGLVQSTNHNTGLTGLQETKMHHFFMPELLLVLFWCSYFFNRTWFSLSKVLGGSNGQTCYIVLWIILMKLTFALNTCKQKSGKADEVPGAVGIFQ